MKLQLRVMALPFTLPVLSLGFAALTPTAREVGRRAAESASSALSELLGAPVGIVGQPLSAPAVHELGTASVFFSLGALPATAALEVDVRLLARTVERLAGSSPHTPAALTPCKIERSVLDLIALVAVDAARSPGLDALVPRLAAAGEVASDALAVALELTVGEDRGRGRLLVPAAAVAALGGEAELHTALAALSVAASFREGTSSLTEDELAALAPGDVLLLDEGTPRAELVIPGGLALRGRAEGTAFHVEEIRMTETQASYPITLSVEVARVSVTLGDLARLEPGSALPLGVAMEGTVVLRAGERAIARGQLVEIDGALGVRLAQIGERP
jgi:flagellar motor switch/type III secretory pathway protein FliN